MNVDSSELVLCEVRALAVGDAQRARGAASLAVGLVVVASALLLLAPRLPIAPVRLASWACWSAFVCALVAVALLERATAVVRVARRGGALVCELCDADRVLQLPWPVRHRLGWIAASGGARGRALLVVELLAGDGRALARLQQPSPQVPLHWQEWQSPLASGPPSYRVTTAGSLEELAAVLADDVRVS